MNFKIGDIVMYNGWKGPSEIKDIYNYNGLYDITLTNGSFVGDIDEINKLYHYEIKSGDICKVLQENGFTTTMRFKYLKDNEYFGTTISGLEISGHTVIPETDKSIIKTFERLEKEEMLKESLISFNDDLNESLALEVITAQNFEPTDRVIDADTVADIINDYMERFYKTYKVELK